MFCPGCGIQTTEDAKFCKNCGANLRGVRDAMASRTEKTDWSKSWLAGVPTAEEIDRIRGNTPEKKRLDEIKGGVVTCFVGIGVTIFLYFFFDAVARKNVNDAEIIRTLCLVGIVPFFVGIGIIFNGLFLSKRNVKQQEQPSPAHQDYGPSATEDRAKTTNQLVIVEGTSDPEYSVVEDTTAHLPERHEAVFVRPIESRNPESFREEKTS